MTDRTRTRWPHWAATLLVSSALLLATGCGGGSGGGGGDTDGGGGVIAPSNLSYGLTEVTYRTDDAIIPLTPTFEGDAPTNWSVAPALPSGLILDASSGALTGTPDKQTDVATCTVTCFNDSGATSAELDIEIIWAEDKSIAAKLNPTEDDLRHFMHRSHMGFSQPHWDSLQSLGLKAYVDAMTTITQQTTLEDDAKNGYLVDGNDPTGEFPDQSQLANYWMFMIMTNQNPFQEVLALHWHDHFATSSDALPGNGQKHYFIDHINLLRNNGAGNLRDFVLALARDPAMLEWLDGVRNNAGNGNEPNENFGREWFELFMLGVDNLYTQTDIVEAARAFSGYRSRFDSETDKNFVEFDANRHNANDKMVLGVLIPGQSATDDFAAMADITVNAVDPVHGRSACGRWIVRQLLRRFVYDNPPENVVNDLTEVLENNNFEIKPVLATMFESEAFFSARARAGIAATPTEAVVAFIRSTSLFTFPQEITRRLFPMGNLPTRPPVVDGWPEGTAWFSAQGMIDRANLLAHLVSDAKALQDLVYEDLGISLRDILPAGTPTTGECVDAMALRLRVDLTGAEHKELVDYMDTFYISGSGTPDPFDITDQDHIDVRVRGALYILAQHPTALTR